MGNLIPAVLGSLHPAVTAFSRAAVVDRECLEHMIAHEIAAILLDAQRRRLERDVRPFPASTQIGANERGCLDKAS